MILHGTIAGNLTIETGARAIIHGTVAGRIYNEGGRVEIFGIADAVGNGSRDAITIIDPAANVRGWPWPRMTTHLPTTMPNVHGAQAQALRAQACAGACALRRIFYQRLGRPAAGAGRAGPVP